MAMARMLDCLVSYFGLDEHGRSGYRRYFCYHVVGGPGPTVGAVSADVQRVVDSLRSELPRGSTFAIR